MHNLSGCGSVQVRASANALGSSPTHLFQTINYKMKGDFKMVRWDMLRPGDVVQDMDGTYLTVTVCYECHVVAECSNGLVRIRETNQHNYRVIK